LKAGGSKFFKKDDVVVSVVSVIRGPISRAVADELTDVRS